MNSSPSLKRGTLLCTNYFMANTNHITITLSFNNGAIYNIRDEYVVKDSLRISRTLMKDMRSSSSRCSVQIVKDYPNLDKILKNNDQVDVSVRVDDIKVFTGILSSKMNWRITEVGESILELNIEDYSTKKLNKTFTDTQQILLKDKAKEVIKTICTKAGVSYDVSGIVDNIDITYVVETGVSCKAILDDLCFECGYVFYFDGNGTIKFFRIAVTNQTPTLTMDRTNLYTEITVDKSIKQYRNAYITYDTIKERANSLVYQDISGRDEGHPYCNIPVEDGFSYPSGKQISTSTEEELHSFTETNDLSEGKEIVYIDNVSPTVLYSGGTNVEYSITKHSPTELDVMINNNGYTPIVINRLECRADVFYKDTIGKIGNINGEDLYSYECKYIHTQDDAKRLSNLITDFYKNSNYTYTFYSKTSIGVGSIVSLKDNVFSGLDVKVLVTSVDYNKTISRYTAVSIDEFNLDGDVYHEEIIKGATIIPGINGENGITEVYVGTDTPDKDEYTVWIDPDGELTNLKGEDGRSFYLELSNGDETIIQRRTGGTIYPSLRLTKSGHDDTIDYLVYAQNDTFMTSKVITSNVDTVYELSDVINPLVALGLKTVYPPYDPKGQYFSVSKSSEDEYTLYPRSYDEIKNQGSATMVEASSSVLLPEEDENTWVYFGEWENNILGWNDSMVHPEEFPPIDYELTSVIDNSEFYPNEEVRYSLPYRTIRIGDVFIYREKNGDEVVKTPMRFSVTYGNYGMFVYKFLPLEDYKDIDPDYNEKVLTMMSDAYKGREGENHVSVKGFDFFRNLVASNITADTIGAREIKIFNEGLIYAGGYDKNGEVVDDSKKGFWLSASGELKTKGATFDKLTIKDTSIFEGTIQSDVLETQLQKPRVGNTYHGISDNHSPYCCLNSQLKTKIEDYIKSHCTDGTLYNCTGTLFGKKVVGVKYLSTEPTDGSGAVLYREDIRSNGSKTLYSSNGDNAYKRIWISGNVPVDWNFVYQWHKPKIGIYIDSLSYEVSKEDSGQEFWKGSWLGWTPSDLNRRFSVEYDVNPGESFSITLGGESYTLNDTKGNIEVQRIDKGYYHKGVNLFVEGKAKSYTLDELIDETYCTSCPDFAINGTRVLNFNVNDKSTYPSGVNPLYKFEWDTGYKATEEGTASMFNGTPSFTYVDENGTSHPFTMNYVQYGKTWVRCNGENLLSGTTFVRSYNVSFTLIDAPRGVYLANTFVKKGFTTPNIGTIENPFGNICGNMVQSSARKMKENIVEFDRDATELVGDIDVVYFNYINDPDKSLHVGFIADDTDSLLSGNNHDRMEMSNCIGVLLKAVQELSNRVKELEKTNSV